MTAIKRRKMHFVVAFVHWDWVYLLATFRETVAFLSSKTVNYFPSENHSICMSPKTWQVLVGGSHFFSAIKIMC